LGQLPGPDLIRSLHSSLANGEEEKAEALKRNLIVIPGGLRKVYPRTFNQAQYLESIETNEIVFGVGPAGTGKTYLAVAQALKQVLGQSRRKLIITRPVVETGESLGFLPGDLTQKIHPYLRPLYDAIESLIPAELFRRLEENGVIEIAPLAYMRGRTLSGAFIILDEAQNTTREQMKMFLTRIGESSRTVITGDITQIDLPRKSDSGLLTVIPILTPIHEIRFTFFEERDVVRNPLVRKIVHAYETAHEE
ncbi:MAG TPA: PhoH family protein, partial [Spirochaetia bacterium]